MPIQDIVNAINSKPADNIIAALKVIKGLAERKNLNFFTTDARERIKYQINLANSTLKTDSKYEKLSNDLNKLILIIDALPINSNGGSIKTRRKGGTRRLRRTNRRLRRQSKKR